MFYLEAIIGLIAGAISGLFSTGGGMIIVPSLMYIFKLNSIKARATSLVIVLLMVLTSSFFYYKNNYIDLKISVFCALGGLIGGYIGSKILKKFSDKFLRIIFIFFLIYVSIKMII